MVLYNYVILVFCGLFFIVSFLEIVVFGIWFLVKCGINGVDFVIVFIFIGLGVFYKDLKSVLKFWIYLYVMNFFFVKKK